MIHAAVLGYGTVGSGVVEVIETNKESISRKIGDEINVKYILDLREFPGDPYEKKVVHDFDIILNDPEVSIICETMGGTEPALTFSKNALLKGKSVCTSNKELVANHGPELIRTAKDNNCNYLFEASVGGGIPIIRPINSSLTAENIDSITGILNGTTNYILTKMDEDNANFDDVLKEAQNKGYAERNPEADIEGYDACRKIAILSSLVKGKNVKFENIYTEGITKITAADFAYAGKLKKAIKLLAMCKNTEDGFYAMVAPFMIPKGHPLYSVSGVFNAVYVHGNMLGDSMYYGRGAGKLPTASAVVSDVIDCARHMGKTIMCFWDAEDMELMDIADTKRRFFVRVPKSVKNKVIETFSNIEEVEPVEESEYAFITPVMSEKAFDEKIALIGGCINRIRIED
ncbi:MAG: homoserine dehydrogenase [Lachnospiraceae bacterium]|nr:homoserine dehydrogenase [Lachnospiraceae bacterium]